MVVGKREETLQEKNLRHIKEMEEDIEGWKNELDFAKKTREYVKFLHICEFSFVILKDNVSRGNIIHATLCKVIYIYTVSI